MARATNKQSDLGGYVDIVTDFIVYTTLPVRLAPHCLDRGLTPKQISKQIGLVIGNPSEAKYISLSCLLGTYFVNAASWMYLAAILEKRSAGAKSRGELTTISMPSGLIEGTETIVFFSLFLLCEGWLLSLMNVMAVLVAVNIVQRMYWAVRHLN